MKTHNVISVSSGKDSTATLLLAVEREAENIQAVFADTGHEHPEVYAYLDYLEAKIGITIRRIKPDFTARIANKREVVKNEWPKDLQDRFVTGFSGGWKLKKGYTPTHSANDNGESITMLKTPGGKIIPMPDIPHSPADIYSSAESGVFVWKSAIKPMTSEQAQHEAGLIVERALSVLVPTGNPFLDLCLWKGRFPSTRARFCTEELKRNPITEQVFMPLMKDPDTDEVWSWQGVRAEESASRATLPEIDEVGDGLFNYRPILNWTAQEVFDFHRKHGVKWNPLYEMGMSRVGCMPCVNCRKDELREIVNRFPEEIERVAEWERLVSLAGKSPGGANLFHMAMVPGTDRYNVESQKAFGIHDVAKWAMTTRGGHDFDMLAMLSPDVGCSSAYGLCDTPVNDNGQVIMKVKC